MKKQTTKGFTLIELLMVIAIIGILAGILIPAVGLVRERATIAASKARISQYLSAIQSFKGEYKYYPFATLLDGAGALDLSSGTNSTDFYETLSGLTLATPPAVTQGLGNRRAIPFYEFSSNELADGLTTGITANTIIDDFGNNQMVIVFDHDNDGEVVVPDPEGSATDTITIRTPLTAYVRENTSLGAPSYYLYE